MLNPGARLGPYEITGSLGAGGMGEVYRARDTRLDRTVAIKILSSDLNATIDLRERFEREARVVAALNHPHICTLYDVGHQADADFLVMEYLEGETLEQRLQDGPLPVDQALPLAVQIASALHAAHRAGIVHRDLKPGNVMLTKSGSVRQGSPQATLLDFGLAKTTTTAVAGSLSMLPTTPPGLTAHGTILGTLQYMAPEQLEGQEADARTDIFAFGAVLYEMLTGTKAFDGKSHASLIGAILRDTPAPVTAAQPLAPVALNAIVGKCLEKDPAERWQSIADVRFALTAFIGAAAPVVTASSTARSRAWLWAGAAGIAVAAASAGWFGPRLAAPDVPSARPVRFSITAPPGTRFEVLGENINPSPTISPDGRMVAYLARASDNSRLQLFVRRVDSEESVRIDGTEGASQPFWSPDSATVAFFAQGELRVVDIVAGAVRPLVRVENPRGGAWSPDGTILIGQYRGGLLRTGASGTAPVEATRLSAGDVAHRFPRFLPDGQHFLFWDATQTVYVAGLGETEPRQLLTDVNSYADFVLPGFLLFIRGTTLMAQRFDPVSLQLRGTPLVVSDRVEASSDGGAGFSGTRIGQDIAFVTGGTSQRELAWMDRRGARLTTVGDPAPYQQVSLSPDNRRIAVDRPESGPGERQFRVWLLDAGRGLPTRFTNGRGQQFEPIWTADNTSVIFVSFSDSGWEIYQQSTTAGTRRTVLRSETRILPEALSPDGVTLLYESLNAGLWHLSLTGEPKPTAYLSNPNATTLNEPEFSPDGKWVVYSANDSGQPEIYMQSFPVPGERVRISTKGGLQAHWRGDGRELFYIEPEGSLVAVPIDISKTVNVGAPVRLFTMPLAPSQFLNEYAVSRDGQRFLVQVPDSSGDSLRIVVTTNWASTVPASSQ
jgi:serine/threonine protein kinase/Tol biopolymer transport system component